MTEPKKSFRSWGWVCVDSISEVMGGPLGGIFSLFCLGLSFFFEPRGWFGFGRPLGMVDGGLGNRLDGNSSEALPSCE